MWAGAVSRLSPAGAVGTHGYQISPDGAQYAVHTFSSFGAPPTVSVVSLPSHDVVQPLVDNEEARRTATTDSNSFRSQCFIFVLSLWVVFVVQLAAKLAGLAVMMPTLQIPCML